MSFSFHETWIYHNSSSKRGLALRAQVRMLETATPSFSLEPSTPTGYALSRSTNCYPLSQAQLTPSPLCAWPAMPRSPPLSDPRNCKEPRKIPHQPWKSLRFLFIIPELKVSHSVPPTCANSFWPQSGVSNCISSSVTMLPTHKQQGRIKKCWCLMHNQYSANTLWFHLKYLFYVICRFKLLDWDHSHK